MKKWLSAILSIILICSMMLAATACSTKADDPASEENTYEFSLEESPQSWSPHTWVDTLDMAILEYVVTPLVANTTDAEGNVEYIYEAATAVTDITAEFADKAQWGITASEGYVYQIDLNPLLTWEDGTKINADTYIYSMQSLLDPAQNNYRAGRYSVGAEAIHGAFDYLNRDKAGQDKYIDAVYVDVDDNTVLYLNPNAGSYFFGNSSMAYYYGEGFAPFFITDDGIDLLEKYSASGDFIVVTDEIKDELINLAGLFGDSNPDAWIEFCHVKDGIYNSATWDDVGLYKTGDYQLILITENPMSMDAFLALLKRNWIVNEKTYESSKETVDGTVVNNYNTGDKNTVSFGPFKLVKYDLDKEFVLEKNTRWYGWDDGKHDEAYPYDKVVISIDQPEAKDTGTGSNSEPGETHSFPYVFETENIYGETVTNETLGEKEIFFVHLWATWCGPCVSEMGEIAKIVNEYSDRVGFLALLTDFDTNAKGAVKLADYNNMPREFINIFSETSGLEDLYEMTKSGYVPTTIIIDGEGNIIGEQIVGSYEDGYIDFIEEALETVRNR